MILCNQQILERLNGDKPLIEPFERSALQSESYDLGIGNSILRLNKEFQVLDLRNQDDINAVYTKEPLLDTGALIGPGEYVLVSTLEKLHMPDDLTAHVRPRTRYTRIGLVVSMQHCNSTYEGRLTLGIKNENAFAIRIVPGLRIAQILFEQLGSVPDPSSQYANRKDSVFQHEEDAKGSDFTTEPFRSRAGKQMVFEADVQDALESMFAKGQ